MTSREPWASEYEKTCSRCGTPHWTEGTHYCRDCYRDRENEKAHAAGVPKRDPQPDVKLGETYGAWTTVELPPVRKGGEAWGTRTNRWQCVCAECGTEKSLLARELGKAPRCWTCVRLRTQKAKDEKAAEVAARKAEREQKRQEARRQIEEAKKARAEAAWNCSKHPLYQTWHGMLSRCSAPGNVNYANYGGRGIVVCEEWQDFATFRDYCEAHLGPKPEGMSIDRKDNDGDYRPGNIRWATPKMQARNTRSNIVLKIDGVTKPFLTWAEEYGLNETEISRSRTRLWKGWEPLDALTLPEGSYPNGRGVERMLTPEQVEEAEARGLTYNLVRARVTERGWTLEEAMTLPKGCIVKSPEAKPPKPLKRKSKKIGCWFCGKSGHRASDHPEYEVYMATRRPRPS